MIYCGIFIICLLGQRVNLVGKVGRAVIKSVYRRRTDNTIAKGKGTKHTHKTKDRVTRIPLKTVGELRCSGRVSSSCYTRLIHDQIAGEGKIFTFLAKIEIIIERKSTGNIYK
jgi:hypothetical protein